MEVGQVTLAFPKKNWPHKQVPTSYVHIRLIRNLVPKTAEYCIQIDSHHLQELLNGLGLKDITGTPCMTET